jgi:hypothetical protein
MARSGAGKGKARVAKTADDAAVAHASRIRLLEAELEEARARIRTLEEERDQVRNRIDWVIDSLHNVIGE